MMKTNKLIQKNSKTQYICEISNLCEELKVEPENWEKVANLSKLSEDFSEVEIFSIIKSNFSFISLQNVSKITP